MTNYSIAGSSGTTGLSALTAPAAGDLLPIVDVSDTSTPPAGSAGSDKKITFANLTAGLTPASWFPSDTGFLAWAFDPAACSNNSAPTPGSIYLIGVQVRKAVSTTGVTIAIQAGGTGLTSGENWMGLYSSSGTRVALTADQTSNFGGGYALVQAAWVSGPFALTAGLYWIAILANGSGAPALDRGMNDSNLINAGLSASTYRYATNGTGTTLPSSITPASNAATGLAFWAALY